MISSAFWRGRRVVLTGHTGFKGAWLTLMLARLTARVTGYALDPPTEPNLFGLARVGSALDADVRGDICDGERLVGVLGEAAPDIVFHMAAQPLVRQGYSDPVETYRINLMGTVHLLEAVRRTPSVRAVVVVTTDKCYENRETPRAYRESDPLGGHDPYSSSKACAEIAAAAFGRSFFADRGVRIVTARAGNVIGGGDFARDRIIPDAVRAAFAGESLLVRNPRAIRPWQHVLDPLLGYLLLAERARGEDARIEGAFNFGPGSEGEQTVGHLLDSYAAARVDGLSWQADLSPQPHEASLLRLDTARAREVLGWAPQMPFADAVAATAGWYDAFRQGQDMRAVTLAQVDGYMGRVVRLVSPFGAADPEIGTGELRRAG